MSNAVPIRIADAVVSQINGHTFAIGKFTAVRSTGSWDKDFKGLDKMSVDVIYRKNQVTINLDTRSRIRYDVPAVIVVRKRFAEADRDAITGEMKAVSVDPLDTLVIDIAKLFISRRNAVVLDDETEAVYEPEEVKPLLGNESYLRQGLYFGMVQIPFSYTEAA